MTEEYLHYLWRMKRLNLNNLQLCNLDKSNIQIINSGWYNTDSGPDFFNGTIQVNELKWSGNIEIHIRSSDWYAHQHHLDKAYENVILHVVYEFDKEVYIDKKILPTIELKNLIDRQHFLQYQAMVSKKVKIPCHTEVSQHQFALKQQIDLSFLHRIERKGLSLLDDLKSTRNRNELLMRAIFKSVGMKTNELPMQELASLIPYKVLKKERWHLIRIEAILFGCAGFLNSTCIDDYFFSLKKEWRLLKNKYQLAEMSIQTWKFGGLRPFSFPTCVLSQLSVCLHQLDWSNIEEKTPIQILKMITAEKFQLQPYWKNHFVFGKITTRERTGFPQLFLNNLLINGIVPYLVAIKHLTGQFEFADKAMELMEKIPPENNKIIQNWQELKIYPKNALESQGLLELYNEFCTFRKCLSCKVGIAVLGNKNEKINPKNRFLF